MKRNVTRQADTKWTRTTCLVSGILLLGACLRLAGITNPVTGHHSWRQADTAAVARNFVEERFNILHPKIDWRGTTTGDVECEFPVFQFLLASLYKLVGVHEIAGRLLSAFFSLAAVAGIYFLAGHIAGVSAGLWAAFFLAILPMPVFFGRTVMPESLLLASAVFAIWFFVLWSESGSARFLFLSWTCLALACLLKPPTLYLGLPLAFLAFRKHQRRTLMRPDLWAYGIALFLALGLWYAHAHWIKRNTGLTFGVWEYGTDKWGNWDLLLSRSFWTRVFAERIPRFVLSYCGLPMVIVGLAVPACGDKEKLFVLWLAGMLVFCIIVAKGVFVHDYYLLPATVPAAYFMGKAAAWARHFSGRYAKWVRVGMAVCIAGTLVVSLRTYRKWLRSEATSKSEAYQVAMAARHLLTTNSLVVAVDKGDPLILYYAHAKGWRSFPRDLTENWIGARRGEGARYVLGTHKDFADDGAMRNLEELLTHHETVTNSGSFFIVTTANRNTGRTARFPGDQ